MVSQKAVKEIIILGMGPSRVECPYDCETWGLNTGYRQVAEAHGRIDRLFLAHSQVYDENGHKRFDWNEINGLGIPVINIHRVRGLKSKIFPLKRIAKKFDLDYFSDTIAYMISYALDKNTKVKEGKLILRHPLKLKLYGVDMIEPDEYDKEKGGLEVWLQYAKCLGVKVEITKRSDLFKTHDGVAYGMKSPKKNRIERDFLKSSSGEMVGEFIVPKDLLEKYGLA